jgi:hypothetical protein
MRSILPENAEMFDCPTKVAEWAHLQKLDAIIMAAPPVGFWDDLILDLESALTARGIGIIKRRHWWDAHFYPAADAGFFKYKKSIPPALDKLADKQTYP